MDDSRTDGLDPTADPTPLRYSRIFKPSSVERADVGSTAELNDASVYVFDDENLILAVNTAVATSRPLLVFGHPGSGKSTLAANVARVLGVPYFAKVFTSRTEARDLLWRIDHVRRLSDAQIPGALQEDSHYWEKGVLWKAFDTHTEQHGDDRANGGPPPTSCVVLLDEIDKAEPDVPDGLLAPLGSFEFTGPAGVHVSSGRDRPLIIITSNNERELSRPFLRRCIIATLSAPSAEHLVAVATARLGETDIALYEAIAELFVSLHEEAGRRHSYMPSTAEFLDAVRACRALKVAPSGPEFDALRAMVLDKEVRRP